MNRWLLALTLAIALLSQTACVTGRRTLSIPVPTAPTGQVTKGAIYISAVTDDRSFQNRPSDPSIPSIDGNVSDLTPSQKDRMIGRQRNGFGRAMGDIALSDDDTVTNRVRLLVTESLRRKGYEVTSTPGAPTSVAVSVNEFWAWTTPGFWVLTFEAKLKTTLTFSGAATGQIVVTSHGINHGQVAKNGNWQEAFEPAFAQYLTNLTASLDNDQLSKKPALGNAPSPLYTELKKLDELRRDGLLSNAEFEVQKRKLLEKN
jgi:hypothetical protein